MRALILDYGAGNLFSIKCSLEKSGFKTKLCSNIEGLREADAIILPGVGNFGAVVRNIGGFRGALLKLIDDGVPLLGICLGMQILFEESDEGAGRGLGIFRGRVIKLPSMVKIPHIGWNTIEIVKPIEILDNVGEKDYFYFVYSYYALPQDRRVVAAETYYGVRFPSIISQRNLFGFQFHPEKSGKPGEQIFRNFFRIVKR
ncbi:MAG: imidazole glycerol phosphate synthase subunit HisH [Candidatus Bathyarchaeota archaeon]|nr:imidazole glycerol phosphate synthase subunit HisH [Candidatus Bathyarchaeota archaeon]